MLIPVLALALAAGLCACAPGGVSAEDATVYVRGLIDQTYLGQFDADYLALVDSTEEEAQEIYSSNLDVDVENFAAYYAIDTVTDELREEIRALYQAMYAKANFEVQDAVRDGDAASYSIVVVVEPLDIYQRVDAALEEVLDSFHAEYFAEHPEALESTGEPGDPAYDAYDAAYAQTILDLFWEKLPEAGYFEAQNVVVQLQRDEETHIWDMPENQFQSLNDYFNYFDYPIE